MTANGWALTDRIMRTLHLYSGLFLTPWMLIYATSAFLMNHSPWINRLAGVKPPVWKVVRTLDYAPNRTLPDDPEELARTILVHLDLDGAHRIQGKPNPQRLVILRLCGRGHYRITWLRQQGKLVVEQQQPFSWVRLVNFLHFKHGYNQHYAAHVAWAVVVDAVVLSIVFWSVSGIYLWARWPRRRRLGGVCVIAGSLLFIVLAIGLCR